ncbi:helicase protein, partial [Opisthorchis viverrini]
MSNEHSVDTADSIVMSSDSVIGGFTVIGDKLRYDQTKPTEMLPFWITQATYFPSDLSFRQKVDDLKELHPFMQSRLADMGFSELFPGFSADRYVNMFIQYKLVSSPQYCVRTALISGARCVVRLLHGRVQVFLRALVILPVRDLAAQVFQVLLDLAEGTDLRIVLINGSKSFTKEQLDLVDTIPCRTSSVAHTKADIVVATPGRLVDHIYNTVGFSLEKLRILVIDEADRVILEEKQDWYRILEDALYHPNAFAFDIDGEIGHRRPTGMQRTRPILASATLTHDPEPLKRFNLYFPQLFASSTSAQPISSNGPIVSDIDHTIETDLEPPEYVVSVQPEHRALFLVHLIRHENVKRVLCFTNSRATAARLHLLLSNFKGIRSYRISGHMPPDKRQRVLSAFARKELDILVCTDSMARGMDIKEVNCVVSYEMPPNVKIYVHRVGRTARAGQPGLAYTLLSKNQFFHFKKDLRAVGKRKLKEVTFHTSQFANLQEEYKQALCRLEEEVKTSSKPATGHSTDILQTVRTNTYIVTIQPICYTSLLLVVRLFTTACCLTLSSSSQFKLYPFTLLFSVAMISQTAVATLLCVLTSFLQVTGDTELQSRDLNCDVSGQGFHLNLHCDLRGPASSQWSTCVLKMRLPRGLYVDPYELGIRQPALNFSLSKPKSSGSSGGRFGRWLSWFTASDPHESGHGSFDQFEEAEVPMNQSEVNVESPEWLAEPMTINLYPQQSTAKDMDGLSLNSVDIPLHLRYKLPNDGDDSSTSLQSTTLPYPMLKCTDGDEVNSWDSMPPFEVAVATPPTSDLLVESHENSGKRKFVPNLKKALNKQVLTDSRPSKSTRGDRNPSDQPTHRSARFGRGAGQQTQRRDEKPQFVQSYSIFETGIGCVVKTDKNAVELRESRPSSDSVCRTEHQEVDETELKEDPLENYQSFVTDIKQVFKDPPVLMHDSAAGTQIPPDPLKDLDLSGGRNHRVPYDFFTDSGPGRLFILHLPDKILPNDLEQLEEGCFGKIQVLDNQQVRLVVGEARFDLISPHAPTASSDVVLVDQRGDDCIRLNCLGHLDEAMVAVPNLDDFVALGQ